MFSPCHHGRDGGGGKQIESQMCSGKKKMTENREHKRKQKRKSETLAEDASIVIQSRFTVWSKNQQKPWARKEEECNRTGKEVRLVYQKVVLGSNRQYAFRWDLSLTRTAGKMRSVGQRKEFKSSTSIKKATAWLNNQITYKFRFYSKLSNTIPITN